MGNNIISSFYLFSSFKCLIFGSNFLILVSKRMLGGKIGLEETFCFLRTHSAFESRVVLLYL